MLKSPKTYLFRAAALAAAGLVALASTSAHAGDIDPRGVFFHSYTGPFSAVEWVHFRQLPGENRYQFSDIRGIAPYNGQILSNGQITWDDTVNTSGTGQFTSQNDATMTLRYGNGTYHSNLRRAPGTDANFLTQIESRTDGNAAINGSWDLTITELDAANGDVIGVSTLTAEAQVTGDLLRLTYDDGTFFQGVFEDPDHAGFRVVLPSGVTPAFDSFPGSATSLAMNLLGDFRLLDEDTISAVFLTQTRRPPGSQDQFVYAISGTRSVPAPGAACLGAVYLLTGSRRRRSNCFLQR
jgi:hypothetical protein